jgi:hypothetical protein
VCTVKGFASKRDVLRFEWDVKHRKHLSVGDIGNNALLFQKKMEQCPLWALANPRVKMRLVKMHALLQQTKWSTLYMDFNNELPTTTGENPPQGCVASDVQRTGARE